MGMTIDYGREGAPMSEEEVVETLKTMVFGAQAFERFNAKEREALDKAWNIISRALEYDKNVVLDKIRAEIEQLPTSKCSETYRMSISAVDFKENVLAIIDKYRAECEGG